MTGTKYVHIVMRGADMIIGRLLPFELSERDLKTENKMPKKYIRKMKKLAKQIDKEIKKLKEEGII